MINKIKRFKKKIESNYKELLNNSKKADDIYALSILQPLMNGFPYVPLNGGALRPISIAYILNEIVINNRKSILEFGSGISTILIARLIKRNNLKVKVYSVEHNKVWASTLSLILKKESLEDCVEIIQAELQYKESKFGSIKWYDLQKINSTIGDVFFDFLIIDGPPANHMKIKYSRCPALYEFKNKLAEDFCIILDDVNREGEKNILNNFIKENPNLNPVTISETMAVIRNKANFNPIPIYYSK